MAIVNCPECAKKLKIADTSIGKKVKCTCGKVFVAEPTESAAAPSRPDAVPLPPTEKVFVACTECQANLKVAPTSLGKRMKCPKCASVFIAKLPNHLATAPTKKNVQVTPADDDDVEDLSISRIKPNAKVSKKDDDEMDALFGFAEAETHAAPKESFVDEDDIKEEDEDEEAPRATPHKTKGRIPPARARADVDDDDDDDDEAPRGKTARTAKPIYPRRTLLNILVLLIVLAYLGFFAAVYFDALDLNLRRPAPPRGVVIINKGGSQKKADDTRIAEKVVPILPVAPKKEEVAKKEEVKKLDEPSPGPDSQELLRARNMAETEVLTNLRKNPRPEIPDAPSTVAVLQPHGPRVVGIAFSPDGSTLASVAQDNANEGIKIWDMKTLQGVKTIPVEVKGPNPVVALSSDGKWVAVASDADKFLKVWKIADGTEVKSLPVDQPLQAVVFSSDSTLLTVVAHENGKDTEVHVLEAPTWIEKPLAASWDRSSAYAADGDRLYEQAMGGEIVVHELRTGKIRKLEAKAGIVDGSRVSPDGKSLASPTTQDETMVQLIELDSGTATSLITEKEPVNRLQFSPDSNYLLYETAGRYKLKEIATKKERWSDLKGTAVLAFSPGGVFVARAEEGASVQILSFEDMLTEKKADEPKKEDKKKKNVKKVDPNAKDEKKLNEKDREQKGVEENPLNNKKTEEKKKDSTGKPNDAEKKIPEKSDDGNQANQHDDRAARGFVFASVSKTDGPDGAGRDVISSPIVARLPRLSLVGCARSPRKAAFDGDHPQRSETAAAT